MRETELIRQRYQRRDSGEAGARYTYTTPSVYMAIHERERVLARWFRRQWTVPPSSLTLLEVGCGSGQNLLGLLRFGLLPENMIGNDLMSERADAARHVLPAALKISTGDAMDLSFPEGSFDIVLQSTVFSSILDREFQDALARKMWHWAAPGGGVLWYDFVYNNPRNPDVAGVPLSRVRSLFPGGSINFWRVTLAPPISRAVTRIHPMLYNLVNTVPFFRTHILCWIQKPNQANPCQTS